MPSVNMASTIKMCTVVALLISCLVCSARASPRFAPPSRFAHYAKRYDDLEAAAAAEVPLVHNNNYDMVMVDDDAKGEETMQFQNFELFYDPQTAENNEYSMDETQFLPKNTPPRAPQPLSFEERQIRQLVEKADPKLEYAKQRKLKKGSTEPRGADAAPWDQFDYDLYSVKPENWRHKA